MINILIIFKRSSMPIPPIFLVQLNKSLLIDSIEGVIDGPDDVHHKLMIEFLHSIDFD